MITPSLLAKKLVVREGRVTVSAGTMFCPYKCTYCYAPHVITGLTKLIEFTPALLKRALLKVKDFKKGKKGTLIFIGRDVEAFAPVETGIAFVKETAKLGNQMSVSTKSFFTKNHAQAFAKAVKDKKQLGVLVTMTCWDSAPRLEPGAPAPEIRIRTVKNLAEEGFNVFVYIKPIVPGTPLKEYKTIIEEAKKAGAKGVIPGYINIDEAKRMLESFKLMGFDTKRLEMLIKKSKLKTAPFAYKDEEGLLWYYVYDKDAFRAIREYAKKAGLHYYENSIAAISWLKKSRM